MENSTEETQQLGHAQSLNQRPKIEVVEPMSSCGPKWQENFLRALIMWLPPVDWDQHVDIAVTCLSLVANFDKQMVNCLFRYQNVQM